MILNDIKAYGPNQLSGLADCAEPDELDSPGAKFLTRVRDGLIEAVEYVQESDSASLREVVDTVRDGDAPHEIADGAPSVYTHELWKQFVDLAAYSEDIEDYGEPSGDMNRNAALALYMIADRLVHSLLNEIEQGAPQYVATINVPGYLPMDDEPPVFDSPREAWEWLTEEREEAEEFDGSPEFSLTVTALREMTERNEVGSIYAGTPGYDGSHDLGLVYSVTEVKRES